MKHKGKRPVKKIQKEILSRLIIIASVTAMLTAVFSIFVNIHSERKNMDRNIQNIAQTIAHNQLVKDELSDNNTEDDAVMCSYLDSLKKTLYNVDVISVVDTNNIRCYHSNSSLIGTMYDGTLPIFSENKMPLYVTSDTGPSGSQRRAYAVIHDKNGNYIGFVIAVTLTHNINRIVRNTILIHLACAVGVIMFAIIISERFSRRIKEHLLGYEPDMFSAMFGIRDNILESLEEGILAVNINEELIYINRAAQKMLNLPLEQTKVGKISKLAPYLSIGATLARGEKHIGNIIHPMQDSEIIADYIPVMEDKIVVGTLCLLRDRTEYTKMMEDLSGVKYMVESMRANNHDFVNKLHVILGLIQMGRNDEASEYITHITSIQQKVLQNIMKNIEDPSVAALLIGKYARASELNIKFTLESGSRLLRKDISLQSGDLVTIIGNLIDNAMDSMNEKNTLPKELNIGIFTQPNAMLINIDDTGTGMSDDNKESIFENGFSTKGENRGTGLYVTKELVKKYGGEISVDSEYGIGTSFTVTLTN